MIGDPASVESHDGAKMEQRWSQDDHQQGEGRYLVVRNSISLLVLWSSWPDESSSSWDMSGRLLVLPPRLRLEEVEEEFRPESGTGDPWPSLRKSKPPPG